MTTRQPRTTPKKPRRKRPVPGEVYEIADTDNRFYYAAITCEGHCSFFDFWSLTPLEIEEIERRQKFFLRLSVMDFSVTDNWKKVGKIAVTGDLNEPNIFRHQSVGSTIVEVVDPRFPNRLAQTKEDFELPKLAVWSTGNVLPVLRYRFFRTPELDEHYRYLIGKPL
jgi:hypothetical protein